MHELVVEQINQPALGVQEAQEVHEVGAAWEVLQLQVTNEDILKYKLEDEHTKVHEKANIKEVRVILVIQEYVANDPINGFDVGEKGIFEVPDVGKRPDDSAPSERHDEAGRP